MLRFYRLSLLAVPIVLALASCQSNVGRSLTPPTTTISPTPAGQAMRIKAAHFVDRNGRLHTLITSNNRARSLSKFDVATANGVDTIDVCAIPEDTVIVGNEICGIQATKVLIDWELTPQPKPGTVASYSLTGSLKNAVDNDTIAPASSSGPSYVTQETINIGTDSRVALDYVDELSCTISNGSCLAGDLNFGILCSVSNLHCPNLEIYDNNLARAVASPNPIGTPLTVIGAPQDLTTKVVGGSGSYSLGTALWTLQGFDPTSSGAQSVIASYSFGDKGASATQLGVAALLNPNLSTFYWLQSSNGIVNSLPGLPSIDNVAFVTGTSNVVVNGLMLRSDHEEYAIDYATAEYSVDGPNGVSFKAALGAAQYGPYMPPNVTPQYTKGTQTGTGAATGFVPAVSGTMPLSVGGTIGISQLIAGGFTVSDAFGNPDTTYGKGLHANLESDGCALYDGGPGPEFVNLGKGRPITYVVSDAPTSSQPPPTMPSVTTPSEQFQDYLMFRPTGYGSRAIWVALSNLTWSWTETLTLKGDATPIANPPFTIIGTPYLSYGTVTISPQPTPGEAIGVNSTTLPQWQGQDEGPNGASACSVLPLS